MKGGFAIVDVAVANCTTLFEQEMEVNTALEEDPTLQALNTQACELQQQYDGVRATARTVAFAQHLARLQEARQLHL